MPTRKSNMTPERAAGDAEYPAASEWAQPHQHKSTIQQQPQHHNSETKKKKKSKKKKTNKSGAKKRKPPQSSLEEDCIHRDDQEVAICCPTMPKFGSIFQKFRAGKSEESPRSPSKVEVPTTGPDREENRTPRKIKTTSTDTDEATKETILVTPQSSIESPEKVSDKAKASGPIGEKQSQHVDETNGSPSTEKVPEAKTPTSQGNQDLSTVSGLVLEDSTPSPVQQTIDSTPSGEGTAEKRSFEFIGLPVPLDTPDQKKKFHNSSQVSVSSVVSVELKGLPRCPWQPWDGKTAPGAVCDNEFLPKLHKSTGYCCVCVYRLSPKERQQLEQTGRTLRVNVTHGGCKNCQIFTQPEFDEEPVRLCKQCFFTTHRQHQRQGEAFKPSCFL